MPLIRVLRPNIEQQEGVSRKLHNYRQQYCFRKKSQGPLIQLDRDVNR